VSSSDDSHRIESGGCRDRVVSPAAQQPESDGRRGGGVRDDCVGREARRALCPWADRRARTGGSQRQYPAPIRNPRSANHRAGSRGPAAGDGPHRIRGHGLSHDVRHVHVAARDGVVRRVRRRLVRSTQESNRAGAVTGGLASLATFAVTIEQLVSL